MYDYEISVILIDILTCYKCLWCHIAEDIFQCIAWTKYNCTDWRTKFPNLSRYAQLYTYMWFFFQSRFINLRKFYPKMSKTVQTTMTYAKPLSKNMLIFLRQCAGVSHVNIWLAQRNEMLLFKTGCFHVPAMMLTCWGRDEINISQTTFSNENVWISIKVSLKFVPKGTINNIPALVQIRAWRRSGDKPLSEPMLVSLPTHICVTRPQWVNWVWLTKPRIPNWCRDQPGCGLSPCLQFQIH